MTATYLTEDTDPFCLPLSSATQLLTNAPWRRFAVIGDSLSAGTGDPSAGYASLGWSDRVADVLRSVRPDLAYLNVASVGATTAQTITSQAEPMTAFGPDLVHLPCGANDLFQRAPDFAAIEQTLRHLFALAANTGAQLTTFTLGRAFVMPRIPDWPDRVRAMNAVTRRLAAEYDAVLVDMWDHPINSRPNLLSADGIHFSASGQAVMAAEVIKALADRLKGAP